jgi:hypothetical protein
VEPAAAGVRRAHDPQIWAEAIAEVLASAPEQLDRTLGDTDGGAAWRAGLGIEKWSAPLTETAGAMRDLLTSDAPASVEQTLDRALALVRADRPGAPKLKRWLATSCDWP